MWTVSGTYYLSVHRTVHVYREPLNIQKKIKKNYFSFVRKNQKSNINIYFGTYLCTAKTEVSQYNMQIFVITADLPKLVLTFKRIIL